MDRPNIEATEDTPEVVFDHRRQSLAIRGNSFPENTFGFYRPIIAWLEEYLEREDHRSFILDMDIGYYNSSTSKVYMNIFNMLNGAAGKGWAIVVNGYYDSDDEDAFEDGEEFRMDMDATTFNILPKEAS